jgi:hypothetical protein
VINTGFVTILIRDEIKEALRVLGNKLYNENKITNPTYGEIIKYLIEHQKGGRKK